MRQGAPAAAPEPAARQRDDRTRAFLEKAAYVVAPGSVIVGLLYYVGRTYTTSYYVHFGVPTSDLQLSRDSYLTVSPDALFFPLWVLLCCALLALALFALIEQWLARPRENPLWQRASVAAAVAGGLLLLLGFLVFVQPPWWSRRVLSLLEPGWPRTLLPPLVVTVGAALALWSLHLYQCGRRQQGVPMAGERVRSMAGAVLIGLLTLSLFFSLARYADEAGDDQAARDADSGFPGQVNVLVYSRSRITQDALGITFKELADDGEPYRYRYSGFVLIAKSSSRYYLVSHVRRQPNDLTVVLPDDGTIRIETLG
ncbi:hypothetical protein GCM10009665_44760 [Kitasatospora nipponensis]|uniref:DUF3592 domain-containing protein n=1 Tax=Kitasatospora nipponensis TaxID=258049 RepID=A0ABN1WGB9_9ACTN